ncbi:MAG: hypothetical protein ABL982_03435 [Vicinamibacterales bacterium]
METVRSSVKSKDLIELARAGPPPMKIIRRGRRHGKPCLVVGPVGLGEEPIGRRQVGDPEPPQFLHQPILLRPVIPLDAALRLRGTGRDDLNAERRAHPSELRPRLGATDPLRRVRCADSQQ